MNEQTHEGLSPLGWAFGGSCRAYSGTMVEPLETKPLELSIIEPRLDGDVSPQCALSAHARSTTGPLLRWATHAQAFAFILEFCLFRWLFPVGFEAAEVCFSWGKKRFCDATLLRLVIVRTINLDLPHDNMGLAAGSSPTIVLDQPARVVPKRLPPVLFPT
jgi:hypothetical protein